MSGHIVATPLARSTTTRPTLLAVTQPAWSWTGLDPADCCWHQNDQNPSDAVKWTVATHTHTHTHTCTQAGC